MQNEVKVTIQNQQQESHELTIFVDRSLQRDPAFKKVHFRKMRHQNF